MRRTGQPTPDEDRPADGGDRRAAANYIASLSGELAEIARRHGLDTLAFILDMARLEAEQAGTRRTSDGSSPQQS